MKKQVYNPYLPLNEYIPDGEPHVFNGRVYLFGSHDEEGGDTFCKLDYVTYSAPVEDLSDWRYEGVIYKAGQDPDYERMPYMYAPDVVCGNDGKYYLYYCMSGKYGYGGYTGPISVAVADKPEGPYRYLGHVQNKDGSLMLRYVCFDPAVMNDDGVIRLYYGTQYNFEEEYPMEEAVKIEIGMFGRSEEEIRSYSDSIMGPVMCTLEDDMLTIKEEPHHIIDYKVKNTDFEKHPFFEAASMRKINDKYYFIYSSMQNHELCYAISHYPDRDFRFMGTIISNGDVGMNGRGEEERTNMTGTTHGSIECINGDYYVFFHRLTHKSDYSRQSCAEKIYIKEDGRIAQVECTSCGLNHGPLKGEGIYPAVICSELTNGAMPHGCNGIYDIEFPNVNNIGEERFIAEIEEGTIIGYKYFDFKSLKSISVTYRSDDLNKIIFRGEERVDERCKEEIERLKNLKKKREYPEIPYFEIRTEEKGKEQGRIYLAPEKDWKDSKTDIDLPDGKSALFFVYHGREKIQLMKFELR